MAINYTAWPTAAQVYALLASANIVPALSSSSDLVQAYIDAAVQELTKRTHRQFLAGSVGEVRYFDGSGTGIMEVDEYLDITAIQLYTLPQVATINLLNYVQVDRATFPKTRIQILQGPANLPYGWFTSFPEGRSNVQITGTWGYGSTIPADVWQAILKKSAADIGNANQLTAKGALAMVHDDDVTVQYVGGMAAKPPMVGDLAGWTQAFDAACRRYKRPLRSFLNRTRPKLV